jgi:transglutaminase-like putative cysteine protease
MIYRIVHKNTYKYDFPVSVGSHVACLEPRSLPHQKLLSSELRITPHPATSTERIDYFGNRLCIFTVQEPHTELLVEARSEVALDVAQPLRPKADLSWELVAKSLPEDRSPAGLDAYQFAFESPRIRTHPDFAAYALQSFTPARPISQALLDLTARIHQDFRFDPKVTNVRTPPEEVFRKRHGVCQDFAQVQIACLRSLHLAARYVSGYLRTYPHPNKPRLVGADASHAWVSVYSPVSGWLDVDPTNNVVPSTDHVTLAWGRDFGDVSPLHGLVIGGGGHTLKVGVDMEPLDSAQSIRA